MTIGDPTQVIYLDTINGIELYIGAIAAMSLLLIVRAVWRTLLSTISAHGRALKQVALQSRGE